MPPFMKAQAASSALQMSSSLPDGVRFYAVGDIHGRLDLLEGLLDTIEQDNRSRGSARTTLIFLGDYVDRGPDSKGVVDRLIAARQRRNLLAQDRIAVAAPAFRYLFLKGNHEHLLLTFLEDPEAGRSWLRYGGSATLLSYGVDERLVARAETQEETSLREASRAFRRLLPDSHLEFYQALELSYRSGDYMFVHAGINPSLPLHRQREEDLLWIRDKFLYWPHNLGCVVVHGHSPEIKPADLPNRIGIDTYAVQTNTLTAAGLEGAQRWFLST
jgi:serine/threonine protein phosphatase 1